MPPKGRCSASCSAIHGEYSTTLASAATKSALLAALRSESEICDIVASPDLERIGRKMRMLVVPVLRDLQPRRHPDTLVLADIIQETDQARGAAGPAGETAVQSHRHHLRRRLPFGIEHVECILEISEKLLAFGKALRIDKAHVVSIKRIGNNELLALRAPDPIGQIVGIGIAEIEEAALLHQQT